MNYKIFGIVGLLLCFFLAGCGQMLPHEKRATEATQSASSLGTAQATALTKQTENPLPSISITGASNSVSIATPPAKSTIGATNAAESRAAVTDQAKAEEKSSIPAGVKMMLWGIGIAAVVFAISWAVKYVRGQSAAAAATFDAADSFLARKIAEHTKIAMNSKDPGEIAFHTSSVAELEKERGKINSI